MTSRPARLVRAFRTIAVVVSTLAIQPTDSHALRLYWSGGATNLVVSQNTRATLIVQADSAEAALPSEWRLLWTADSLGIEFVAPESLMACLTDTAKISAIEPPSTPADSAANLLTAHFCSDEIAVAPIAYWSLDLAGGGRGKLKVVALDPVDSNSVIESNEVTYNGGVSDDFEPCVLRATSVHQSLQLRVTAVGTGLNGAISLSIMAPDSSWALPLAVTSRSDRSVTGTASIAALLPSCQVTVGSAAGSASAAALAADAEPESESPQSCQAQYFEELLQPPPYPLGYTIQPKDFAFARGFVDESSSRYALHLFYIRHNYYYYPPPPAIRHPELDEKNLGHIWTTDFNSWYGPGGLNKPDTVALAVRSGKFDEFHVWAPTIVQNGPTFTMFYTGVRSEGGKEHQRIGRATSSDLITWTPVDDPVLTAPDVPWASKNPPSPYSGSQQLRDPFVMEDPVNPGKWLMYFVALDSCDAPCTPTMAVGVARSTDLATWSALPDPFSSTQRATSQGATNVVESPHVFRRNGQWWMPYTVNLDQIYFETSTSADPADTVAANWTEPVRMRDVTEGEPSVLRYWHASEYLRINSTQYLAAFDDNAISIDIKGVFQPANAEVDSFRLDCPQIAGVHDNYGSDEVRMAVARSGQGRREVGLRLELPTRMSVRLAVYDIAGRRRATILDQELAAGATEVTWNGRDVGGEPVSSGIYFVRLTFAGGARLSKIVMLR